MAKRTSKPQALEVTGASALVPSDDALGVDVEALPPAPGFVAVVSKRTTAENLAAITAALGHALPHGACYLREGEDTVYDLTDAPTLLLREHRYWGRHDYDDGGKLIEAVADKAAADRVNATRDRENRLRESWLVLALHVVGGAVRLSLSRQQDGSSRWCEKLARGIKGSTEPRFFERAARSLGTKVTEALQKLPARFRVEGALEGDTRKGYNLIDARVGPCSMATLQAVDSFMRDDNARAEAERLIATFDKRVAAITAAVEGAA